MLAIAFAACRSAPPPREAELERRHVEVGELEAVAAEAARSDGGELRFALAFGGEADLDLFVTGPRQETVYFANTPSAVGGELEADLRCDAPAPRAEIVTFRDAPAGRYRVSVDFPRRCDGEAEGAAPYAVHVARDGVALGATHGIIRPGEFLTIVLETEID